MNSNIFLIQAASGLEKSMVGIQGNIIKDSTVAQISSTLYYQAHVLANITNNKEFTQRFKSVVFKQIMKDFGEYVDSIARVRPKSLHHVYEWGRAGDASARLYKLKSYDGEGASFKVGYEFTLSKSLVPGRLSKRRHVFSNKAEVMESGRPLVISPRYSQRLVFENNGNKVFMPKGKSVLVKSPGGKSVKNEFTSTYRKFFMGPLVQLSVKKSGFVNMFNLGMTKAMRIPAEIRSIRYRYSPMQIQNLAKSSVNSAFTGGIAI